MSTAVDTKDLLWNMIGNNDGPIEFCRASEQVLNILTVTEGMWQDLDYTYKAKEIASYIARRAFKLQEDCVHAQTLKSLEKVKLQAWRVEDRFHKLQYEDRVHPVLTAV